MRRLKTLLFFALASLTGHAQYITSVDLSVKHLQDSEYLIYADAAYGCYGWGGTGFYDLNVQLTCNGEVQDTITLEKQNPFGDFISVCPSNTLPYYWCGCIITANMILAFAPAHYEAVIDLEAFPSLMNCDTFTVSSINGFFPSTQNQAYNPNGNYWTNKPPHAAIVELIKPDSTLNSSPHAYGFDSPIWMTKNDEISISMAMIDLDGDSLVYSFYQTFGRYIEGEGFDTVYFDSGYTAQEPMPSISIDGESGLVKLSPPPYTEPNFIYASYAGYGMTIRTDEYDPSSGAWKGRTHRNYWFGVYDDSTNLNPHFLGIDSVQGAELLGDSVQVEVGQPFSMFVSFADANLSDSLEIESNLELVSENYSVELIGVNPVTAKITATLLQPCTRGFDVVVRAYDDHCPYRGFTSTSIHISGFGVALTDQSQCAGTWAEFETAADSVVWTSVSGNALINGSTFNCLGQGCGSAKFKFNDTTIIAISALHEGVWYQDTFSVNVLPAPIVDITLDGAPCVTEIFWVKAVVLNSDSFSIEWTDNYNLIPNHFADSFKLNEFNADTLYFPYVVASEMECVTEGVYEQIIHPYPSVDAGQYDETCVGQPLQLTPSGAATYAWAPSTYLSSSTGAPTATLFGNITYVVTGTDSFGCSSTDFVQFSPGSNYILGNAVDPNQNPVDEGTVYLLDQTSTSSNEVVLNSNPLGLDGSFLFAVTVSAYFIKVVPDASFFPTLLPTYFGPSGALDQAELFAIDYCDTAIVEIQLLKEIPSGFGSPSEAPFGIFPNPTSDFLNFGRAADRSVVLSTDGRALLEMTGPRTSMDVSALNPGLYILRTSINDSVFLSPFVKL